MLLISNDDGIEALGLRQLIGSLDIDNALFVIAPKNEQSAVSHALSLRSSLRYKRLSPGRVWVDGTPADCVYLGLHHFCSTGSIEMVVSGINKGTNLGTDSHYSGTVAAAKEGALHGVRSLAVSLEHPPLDDARPNAHWATAAAVTRCVVSKLRDLPDSEPLLWSLNIPDLPLDQLRGLKVCRPGKRFYHSGVKELSDGTLRLGGAHKSFCNTPGTDGYWFQRGFAVLAPLALDWSISEEIPTDTQARLESAWDGIRSPNQ